MWLAISRGPNPERDLGTVQGMVFNLSDAQFSEVKFKEQSHLSHSTVVFNLLDSPLA